MTDNALGIRSAPLFDFASNSVLGFLFLAAVAVVSRKWCAVPVSFGCIAVTLVLCLSTLSSTNPYASNADASRFVLLTDAAARRQIEVREEWLASYAEAVPRLKSVLADPSKEADAELGNMIRQHGNAFLSLKKYGHAGYRTIYVIPPSVLGFEEPLTGQAWTNWIALDEARIVYGIELTDDFDKAIDTWHKKGGDYLAYLESARASIEKDNIRFATPVAIEASAIARRMIYVPLALVTAFGVLGLVVNGLVMVMMDFFSKIRMRAWRRIFN